VHRKLGGPKRILRPSSEDVAIYGDGRDSAEWMQMIERVLIGVFVLLAVLCVAALWRSDFRKRSR